MLWKRRILAASISLAISLGAARAADIPRHTPEFAVNIMGGKQLLLSQYRGKVVALLFILTYCPHCQHTVQALAKVQQDYPNDVQVLCSAIEDMAAMAVPDFIKRYNPPFPVGYSERNSVVQYLQHPSMLKLLMPQLVFIDRQGAIRAQYSGEDKFFGDDQEKNIRTKIAGLVKDGPLPAANKKPAGSGKKK